MASSSSALFLLVWPGAIAQPLSTLGSCLGNAAVAQVRELTEGETPQHKWPGAACTQRGFTNAPFPSPTSVPFKKEGFVSGQGRGLQGGDQEGSWKLFLRQACCEDTG